MSVDDDKSDSVRDEFLSEAQEIIESLSRDLLLLDHGKKRARAIRIWSTRSFAACTR